MLKMSTRSNNGKLIVNISLRRVLTAIIFMNRSVSFLSSHSVDNNSKKRSTGARQRGHVCIQTRRPCPGRGTYKYHHAKFVKNAGAFSERIVLESTGAEKAIWRHNLRIVLQQQRSQERNTAATSGVTSTSTTGTMTEDSIKAEDNTRSEVASATATATTPSHHQE
jgi:hypothetical protein